MIDSTAEQMNRIYRYQRGIYDLTRRYYLLGRTSMIAGLQPPPNGNVLEVGCGTASNLIAAARAYPDATLFGFDVSTEMLATASRSIARAGLNGRIRLAPADATTFDGRATFGVAKFDRIFASYMLSMVPQWPRVLEAMARNLDEGGSIHIVDFGDCQGLPHWFKRGLYQWLEAFHVTPRTKLATDLRAFADGNGLALEHAQSLRGYTQTAVLSKRTR